MFYFSINLNLVNSNLLVNGHTFLMLTLVNVYISMYTR